MMEVLLWDVVKLKGITPAVVQFAGVKMKFIVLKRGKL
jgi:hypothetical protein